jgi:hypothetical protein
MGERVPVAPVQVTVHSMLRGPDVKYLTEVGEAL